MEEVTDMKSLNIVKKGFTLVELLVVISIIGVLAAIGLGSFTTAQMRGRDAQRKSDLKQISHSLEIYYSDHGSYPASITFGSEFTDTKTVYFKKLPTDPSKGYSYVYRVPDTLNKKYQLYARIENPEDKDILDSLTESCGTNMCNFAVTSPNTNPTE